MECMCALTRPRFTLSSERVLGNGVVTHVNKKNPFYRRFRRGSNPRRCIRQDTGPTHCRLSNSGHTWVESRFPCGAVYQSVIPETFPVGLFTSQSYRRLALWDCLPVSHTDDFPCGAVYQSVIPVTFPVGLFTSQSYRRLALWDCLPVSHTDDSLWGCLPVSHTGDLPCGTVYQSYRRLSLWDCLPVIPVTFPVGLFTSHTGDFPCGAVYQSVIPETFPVGLFTSQSYR